MATEDLLKDSPVLLVFIQTACRSCVREMIALKALQEDRGRFEVVGVFLDARDRNLMGYIEDYDLPFYFAWDDKGRTAEAFGVSLTPASFLIDAGGKVANTYEGFRIGNDRQFRGDLDLLQFR